MSDYDWTQFTTRIYISSSPAEILRSWISPREIERWFVLKARHFDPARPRHDKIDGAATGDEYLWRWVGGSQETGRFLEVKTDRRLRFTFGRVEGQEILVTVEFHRQHNDTRLTLTQEGLPTDEPTRVNWHMGCRLGWAFFLVNLKAYLEHGIDLRESNPRRVKTGVANY
jgi:uncharacterized protein YndB with AHSA1/START domain